MSYLPYAQSGGVGWIAATGSSALVHAGVFALTLGGMQQLFQPTEAAQPPDTKYTITLEQLDSDTLAGLEERLGEAGAAGEEPEGTDPEALDSPEVEELAALEPNDTLTGNDIDTVETAEPEVLEATPEPESLDPVPEAEADPVDEQTEAPQDQLEPETVEALPEAETIEAPPAEELAALEPVVPSAPTTEALSPIEVDPGPLIPETARPVSPTVETLSARPRNDGGSTDGVTTVAPTTQTATRVAPSSAAPQAVRPTSPQAETIAAARPAVPRPDATTTRPAAQRPPPSAQDLAIGDLIRRIRTATADACLLALPRRDGEDGVGLAMIAANDQAMGIFVDTALTEDDADIRQTRTLVDPRQCPAVSYIRQNRDYPATRLGIRLDSNEVPSGGRLTGTVRGTAGKYILLLLVDNNGVVQDLQRFLSFSGNFTRFDVPVTRAGPPRDTSQILLAIGTNRPPNVIRDRIGRLAQDVFAGLDGALAEDASLAVVTFDVR